VREVTARYDRVKLREVRIDDCAKCVLPLGGTLSARAERKIEPTPPSDLRPILEAARDRLGAKLNYLEVDGLTAGRGKLPWWWQVDWS